MVGFFFHARFSVLTENKRQTVPRRRERKREREALPAMLATFWAFRESQIVPMARDWHTPWVQEAKQIPLQNFLKKIYY